MKDAGNKWESRMAKKYYDKLFKGPLFPFIFTNSVLQNIV